MCVRAVLITLNPLPHCSIPLSFITVLLISLWLTKNTKALILLKVISMCATVMTSDLERPDGRMTRVALIDVTHL